MESVLKSTALEMVARSGGGTALRRREWATVLAALRYDQQGLGQHGGMPPADVADMATDGGTGRAMDVEAIDVLCEWLNTEADGARPTDAPGTPHGDTAAHAGGLGDVRGRRGAVPAAR